MWQAWVGVSALSHGWQYASKYHKASVSPSVKWVVKDAYFKELLWEFQETVPGRFIIYSRISVGLWWTLMWTIFLFFHPFWALIHLPSDMMLIKCVLGGGVSANPTRLQAPCYSRWVSCCSLLKCARSKAGLSLPDTWLRGTRLQKSEENENLWREVERASWELGFCDQLCPCVQCNFVMGFNVDKFPSVSMLMEAGCLSLPMSEVLINKLVIRKTRNSLGKNTHEFYCLIT